MAQILCPATSICHSADKSVDTLARAVLSISQLYQQLEPRNMRPRDNLTLDTKRYEHSYCISSTYQCTYQPQFLKSDQSPLISVNYFVTCKFTSPYQLFVDLNFSHEIYLLPFCKTQMIILRLVHACVFQCTVSFPILIEGFFHIGERECLECETC